MAASDADRMRAARRVRAMESAMEPVFAEALERVLAETLEHAGITDKELESLTAALNPVDLKVLLAAWEREIRDTITPRMTQWYRDAAAATLDRLPPGLSTLIGPNVRDTRAVRYMGSIENRLKGIGETLYQRAAEALRVSLEQGEGVPTAAQRVRDVLDVSDTRATVIARTEAAAVINGADQSIASELQGAGVVTHKEWLATGDTRTRQTHRDADGQRVPVDKAFTVGGSSLMYPGDPNGPADEVIQCRCTTLLHVDESSLDLA